MRLAKLTVSGFKSFADKTELTFDAPVTGIVGPNGCGKSNVVDAIKWVLGEQSAKSLRGHAMLDVIFNGSATRKPAGLASVTLTFDNPLLPDGRRKLPLDLDSVSVTRQLYRDGSSEYLINKHRSRLRDIRDLFMDTGVGTDAYSVIEQGKVDVLLQANALQRREIFEEAAGISKFKARKIEAQRKLERTEQNLALARQRLDDAQRRLRSVQAQASRARRHQELTQQLRGHLETSFLVQYRQLRQTADDLATQSAQTQAAYDQAVARQAEQESTLAQAQQDRQAAADQQQQVQHQTLELQARQQQAAQRLRFSEETSHHLSSQISRDTQRCQELAQRTAELQKDLEHQLAQDQALQAAQAQTTAKLEQAQQQSRLHEQDLHGRSVALDEAKAQAVQLMRRLAQAHNQIHALEAFEKNLTGNSQRLTQRSEQLDHESQRLTADRQTAAEGHQQTQDQITRLTEKLGQIEQQAQDLDAQHQQLTRKLAAAREQRCGLESRRAVLKEMQDRHEGVAQAVRAVLDNRQSKDPNKPAPFAFVHGLLAEMVEADLDNAQLVEWALAEHQQSLVIDRLTDLCDHLQPTLAALQKAGRVTFLPIDQFTPPEVPPPPPEASQATTSGVSVQGDQGSIENKPLNSGADANTYPSPVGLSLPPGVVPVSRFIKADARIAPFVQSLLGRTLKVPSLESALLLRPALPPGYRFVTPQGELVDADGRVTLGQPVSGKNGDAAPVGGLISRRSELTRLNRQIADLDRSIDTDQTQLATLDQRAAELDQSTSQLRQTLHQAQAKRIELASRIDHLDTQFARAQKELSLLAAEITQLQRQLQQTQQEQQSARAQSEELDQQLTAAQQSVADTESQLVELKKQADHAREEVTAARVELGKVAEQAAAAARHVRQAQLAADDAQRQQALLREHLAQHESRIAEMKATAHEAQKEIDHAVERLRELKVRADLMAHRLAKADETLAQIRQELTADRQNVERTHAQLSDLHLRQRELELQEQSLNQRAHEQLAVNLVEFAQNAPPVDDAVDLAHTETQIKELRQKLHHLGSVNLDAIAEQDELQTQSQQLATQVDDIESAKNQLERLIRQINDDCRSRFESTFERIRENFAGRDGMFRRLFGGGRADLVLIPDDQGQLDVLECGIDVVAKPPGKQPQSITLLSGGEKTMTAVALLMSIFMTKPSPFCILDEVDAALDDANVERFANVVRSFLDRSHFIIITHNKKTMQAAEILYGITMQEQGVSKQVSVRLEQVGPDGQIARDAVDRAPAPGPATPPTTTPIPTEQNQTTDTTPSPTAEIDSPDAPELVTAGAPPETPDAPASSPSGDPTHPGAGPKQSSVRSRLAALFENADPVEVDSHS